MKKFAIAAALLLILGSFSFGEGQARKGQFGIRSSMIFTGTSLGNAMSLGAKYMLSDTGALVASLGLLNISSGSSSTTAIDFGGGFEYHLAAKGGVSPYVGGILSFSGGGVKGATTNPSDFGICAVFGGEYFFSSNFSWSGGARLGFETYSNGTTQTNFFGTYGLVTALTWYVN